MSPPPELNWVKSGSDSDCYLGQWVIQFQVSDADPVSTLCVTHAILPFSSLNLGRTILIDVDSSKIYNVSMAMIKLLTGSGPA